MVLTGRGHILDQSPIFLEKKEEDNKESESCVLYSISFCKSMGWSWWYFLENRKAKKFPVLGGLKLNKDTENVTYILTPF